jgi:hypothetical protein
VLLCLGFLGDLRSLASRASQGGSGSQGQARLIAFASDWGTREWEGRRQAWI